MAITNYSELQNAIAEWMNRSDLIGRIPDLIELATARLSDELRVPDMEKVATTTISAEWTLLPLDFRAIRLFETGGQVLEYKTPWQLQKLIESGWRPTPGYYTIQDMQFRIYPTPSSAVVELTYYAALDPLVNGVDTNWLLQKRPDVYLQAALSFGWQLFQDDAKAAAALAYVDKYIAEANRAGRRMATGAAPLAIRAA